jgi:hypothetical protein
LRPIYHFDDRTLQRGELESKYPEVRKPRRLELTRYVDKQRETWRVEIHFGELSLQEKRVLEHSELPKPEVAKGG